MENENEFYESEGLYLLRHYKKPDVHAANLIGLHYDDNLCLIYFKHASGSAKIEGRHYEIAQGDLFIVSPYELHRFSVDESAHHERFALFIMDGLLSRFPKAADALLSPVLGRRKGYGNLIPAHTVTAYGMDKLFEEFLQKAKKRTPDGEALAACKALELLGVLAEATESVKESAPVPRGGKMSEVLKYLDSAYLEELSLDDIASRFFISKYHLCRAFKESTGMTIWEYVIWRRLLHFNECVREGVALEDACRASGFCNYSNFYRLYIKHFHMTPRAFAAKAGKQR